MRCLSCGGTESRVVDSRTTGDAIRRRRECFACGVRFTTHERVEKPSLWVIKKNGAREVFSAEKILKGVALACRKRPVELTAMELLAQEVEMRLREMRVDEVSSARVGQEVVESLRKVDDVAYVRFASVYREFESVDQFIDAIRPLRECS